LGRCDAFYLKNIGRIPITLKKMESRMVWKPRNDAHAIERVRVQFHFRDVIPKKGLRRSADVVERNFSSWGFNGLESATNSNQIKIDAQLGTLTTEKSVSSGVKVKRMDNGVLLEELALVENVFGYLSTTYSAWKNFRDRLKEIAEEPLDLALQSTDLSIIRLDYWDGFEFSGVANEANVTSILRNPDASIPSHSIEGKSLWHSNVGWIEQVSGLDLLINRNINTFDKVLEGEPPVRQMGIYTLAEIRLGDSVVSTGEAFSLLEDAHKRSVFVFADCLTPAVVASLGIDQDKYK
jgi:hypothetical protein